MKKQFCIMKGNRFFSQKEGTKPFQGRNIVRLVLTSSFHDCMGQTVSYERFPVISVFSQVLTDFPIFLRSLLIYSFHIFLGCPLEKLLLPLAVVHSLDQALFSIRSPNHCTLLSCKHCLMLFNFSLFLSSSAKILSSDLT